MSETGSCWLIKFAPCETMDTFVSEFFDDWFDVVAVNYTDDGQEEYVGYKSKFDERKFQQVAEQRNISLPPYHIEFLESKNWLKENVIKFAPVKVAEFTIYGIHETDIPDDGRLNLRIYAATAFGSEHQTTRSCLQAISDYNKIRSTGICPQASSDSPYKNIDFCETDTSKSRSAEAERTLSVREHSSIGICSQASSASPHKNIDFCETDTSKSRSAEAERTLSVREHSSIGICSQASSEINILDMGTGSGILSLACAKLWQGRCRVTAVDIDEEAVMVTRQNAKDNDLEGCIKTAVSDGYNSELVRQNAPYDLIVANILARPLIAMAPDLYKSLKQGGYCILSGFVEEQEQWVIGEHEKLGLVLRQIYKIDNWRAALLEKA